MKRNPLSRRQFLTLSASTVAATALAACATVSAPSAPAAQEATAGEVAQVPCGDMSASGERSSALGRPKEVRRTRPSSTCSTGLPQRPGGSAAHPQLP